MATKSLFKILYQIYLFPHRSQRWKIERLSPSIFSKYSKSFFFETYLLLDRSAHFLYVQGLDAKGSKIPVTDHLQRGACLSRLTDMWLSTWGEEEENVE